MDYPLENLNDESFQQLCQSLLAEEYKGLRCLPVGQPDGGRDAVWHDPITREFIVFQVKFSRTGHADGDDVEAWLRDVVKREMPKIQRLVSRGAVRYVLLTNVRASAHLDVGVADRVEAMLADLIPIAARCWFRDDINRRLDNAWDLKWVHPEILTPPDLLRAVVQTTNDEWERRYAALTAFITQQYETDERVRFKQIELQNMLLDLYVDVPIERPMSAPNRRLFHENQAVFDALLAKLATPSEPVTRNAADRERPVIGAATFFLNALARDVTKRCVLEGAPGQGKSTVVQYLCQVHRMRLLGRADLINQIPATHQGAPLRLPIKVDLRDFAVWLDGRNPFASDTLGESASSSAPRTLESFLAVLIEYSSGGIGFSVNDLVAIVRSSAVLVVLDGLDEIAAAESRRAVVVEISRGLVRLESNSTSLQAIVTSRPAAFANSPGMPPEKFVYLQLGDVDRLRVNEYTEKWSKARRLSQKEAAEVRAILKDKLDQPHLRDLARNPMQLAILLSLIHSRGASLPDKRTALYDQYVDLFFSREAEKSVTVRKYRDLLVHIHRYLAWWLHAAAEEGNRSGSIDDSSLRRLLREFLAQEDHDVSLVDELFKGMVERVVALVARVEGLYEFEVQPLREYFAARFLYETAPYSPTGAERSGTKPDRFDALARSPYWLNVVRFYAGCYSKGELPSLIENLRELLADEDLGKTSHPRILASALLSDWVFTQYPKHMRDVVRMILDPIGLRYILAGSDRSIDRTTALQLPSGCGREELLVSAFNLLSNKPPRDFGRDLLDVINANATRAEKVSLWQSARTVVKDDIVWLQNAVRLGIIREIPNEDLRQLLLAPETTTSAAIALLRAGRHDLFNEDSEAFEAGLRAIAVRPSERMRVTGDLAVVASLLTPYTFQVGSGGDSLADTISDRLPWAREMVDAVQRQNSKDPRVGAIMGVAREVLRQSPKTWQTTLEPWDRLVEVAREHIGTHWATIHLACAAAGIRNAAERCSEFRDTFDMSTSLCSRIRYARLRTGQPAWWSNQLDGARSETDRRVIVAAAVRWASVKTLLALGKQFSAMLDAFAIDDWRATLRIAEESSPELWGAGAERNVVARLSSHSVRVASVLTVRGAIGSELDDILVSASIEIGVAERLQRRAIRMLTSGGDWHVALLLLRKGFEAGTTSEPYTYHSLMQRNVAGTVPLDAAEEILSNAGSYPGFAVGIAQQRWREAINSRLRPVAAIAREQGWLSTSPSH